MGSVFHEMTEEEILKALDHTRTELRELRFTFAVARSLQSPGRIRLLKRNVARMLTVLEERKSGRASLKERTERKEKPAKVRKEEEKRAKAEDAKAKAAKPAAKKAAEKKEPAKEEKKGKKK